MKFNGRNSDETHVFGPQIGSNIINNSKERWSVGSKSQTRNPREFMKNTFNRHLRTHSVNNRASAQSKCIKTEPSLNEQVFPINIQKFMREVKLSNMSFSRSIELPHQNLTINQIMIDKFQSRRKYENSKIIRHNMLPSFLNFSISKCQLHEKTMMCSI